MRVAVVGAGAIAQTHAGHLAELGHELAGVCDPAAERARALAAPAGARAYAGVEELLDGERPDAVLVCSPPADHAAAAAAAFGRGIPVYLEKPLARVFEDGRAIVAAWRDSGCVCAVGYQWRSLDILAAAREELHGSPPGLMVARSYGPTEPARGDVEAIGSGSWFTDPRQSGGILFELASHDVDLLLALAGEAEAVQATAAAGGLALRGREAGGLHDVVSLAVRFCAGGIGAVHVGWTTEGSRPVYEIDVLAADATLTLELDPRLRLRGRSGGREVDVRDRIAPRLHSQQRFFAAVEGGDPGGVACTPADALGTLAVVLAAETAIATGAVVPVPVL
ncbi:MAG TPA: Gfo/Idh/MocA family oxidoreductase [Gaiellales bacterium]